MANAVFNNQMKSLMQAAWALVKNNGISMGDAMKAAWSAWRITTLKQEMKKGVVNFQFRKKDGTIRIANGTTNLKSIGKVYVAAGGNKPANYGYMSFFDVDKNDWRCFKPSNLIAVGKAK